VALGFVGCSVVSPFGSAFELGPVNDDYATIPTHQLLIEDELG
jgi:hypothetical protein